MVDLGYEIGTASDGQMALDAIASHRPDLVLLDINMPKIDGFEVCRRIKADPATRLVPVVLITGLTGSEEHIRGIEAGADDFLTKPFKVAELEARVRSLIRLKRYTDELDSAESVILSLGLTIEARDPYTQGHCEHLAQHASALGVRSGSMSVTASRSIEARFSMTSARSASRTQSCSSGAIWSRRSARSWSSTRSSATDCAAN